MHSELIEAVDKQISALVLARKALTGEDRVMYLDFMIVPIIRNNSPAASGNVDPEAVDPEAAPKPKPGRRAFTPAQREEQARRMKEYWKKKRSASKRKTK